MTTYNKIAEQIQRLYAKTAADKENLNPKLHAAEVRLLVEQVANELLALEPKSAKRVGDTSIPSCMIATYPAQTVYSSLTVSATYANTAAMISAQGGQTSGLYYFATDATDDTSVVQGGSGYKYLGTTNGDLTDYEKTYIYWYVDLPAHPIQLPFDIGVWAINPEPTGAAYIPITSAHQDLLVDLDEALLEDSVGFMREGRKAIFTKKPSATVKIKLLIIDVSQLEANDPFPIPPEMEATLIQRVLQLLLSVPVSPDQPKG